MSLKPQAVSSIPQETRRVAQAAFPQGNTYMKMRDERYAGESIGNMRSVLS